MNKLLTILVYFICCQNIIAQNTFMVQQKMASMRSDVSEKTAGPEESKNERQNFTKVEFNRNSYIFSVQFESLKQTMNTFLSQCNDERCKELNKEKIKYYNSMLEKIDEIKCIDKNSYAYINKLKEIYRTWRTGVFNIDTVDLSRIDTVMRYCRDFYTEEFLTTKRPTRGFLIFKAAKYDINKINDYIYNQKDIDIFQSAALQYANNKVFVGAEVASLLVGPVRIGIGGSFESAGDSTDDAVKTSLQKIISNRGTANINISFPFWYYRSRSNQLHWAIMGQMNNGFNPSIDTLKNKQDFSSFYYSNQSGLNFYLDISSNDQKGRISIEFPFIYSFGVSDAYRDLKIADFWILKTRLGIQVNSLIGISITGPLWSSSKTLQSVPFTIGFNFSPSQITKAR